MKIPELRALLDFATPGPWKLETIKGETECGYPIECDWNAITGPQGIKTHEVELCNPTGVDTNLAVALRNAASALLACAEALQTLTADVQDYEAWQRPCYALDKARAALKALEDA